MRPPAHYFMRSAVMLISAAMHGVVYTGQRSLPGWRGRCVGMKGISTYLVLSYVKARLFPCCECGSFPIYCCRAWWRYRRFAFYIIFSLTCTTTNVSGHISSAGFDGLTRWLCSGLRINPTRFGLSCSTTTPPRDLSSRITQPHRRLRILVPLTRERQKLRKQLLIMRWSKRWWQPKNWWTCGRQYTTQIQQELLCYSAPSAISTEVGVITYRTHPARLLGDSYPDNPSGKLGVAIAALLTTVLFTGSRGHATIPDPSASNPILGTYLTSVRLAKMLKRRTIHIHRHARGPS